MTVFGEVPAPAVQLAIADPEGWAANVAAGQKYSIPSEKSVSSGF